MSRIDQLHISHDTVDVSGTATTTYGSDIPLKSVPDNDGKMDAVVAFPTEIAGAGNITVNLYGGASAAPTAIIQTLFSGTIAELNAALMNGELKIGILPKALKAVNRFGIINSGTLTAGKILSFITPKDPVMG